MAPSLFNKTARLSHIMIICCFYYHIMKESVKQDLEDMLKLKMIVLQRVLHILMQSYRQASFTLRPHKKLRHLETLRGIGALFTKKEAAFQEIS